MARRSVLIAFATVLLSSAHSAVAQPTQKADDASVVCPSNVALANLIAQSDLVVLASPEVPVGTLKAAELDPSPDYIDLRLREALYLKGSATSSNRTVRYYPKASTYNPSPQKLIQQASKPSLLFLTNVDEGRIGLYFTQSSEALQEATERLSQEVRAEIRRQEALERHWSAARSLPHFQEVHALLSKLPSATAERQRVIFRELEALGEAGVPAIVAQMDDRRRLAQREIDLDNHAVDAFEGVRHYGPELVVDALDAILNQTTGFGGSIVNGGSERERRSAVAAWHVYVADSACE